VKHLFIGHSRILGEEFVRHEVDLSAGAQRFGLVSKLRASLIA